MLITDADHLPVIIPGATEISVSSAARPLPRAAHAALIVPARSLYGAPPIGVVGAGSSAVPHASVSSSVP
jgi:hypothetical protein